MPFSRHKLNWDLSVDNARFESLCTKLDYQQFNFFGLQCLAVNWLHIIVVRAYRPSLWNLFRIVWLETIYFLAEKNCFRIWVALALLFWWNVNRMYRSLFAAVARGRSYPSRNRTCYVSLNRFRTLAKTLLAAPTAFATLYFFLFAWIPVSPQSRKKLNPVGHFIMTFFSHLFTK